MLRKKRFDSLFSTSDHHVNGIPNSHRRFDFSLSIHFKIYTTGSSNNTRKATVTHIENLGSNTVNVVDLKAKQLVIS